MPKFDIENDYNVYTDDEIMAIQQEHLPTSFETIKSGCLSLFDPFVVRLPKNDANDTTIVTELQDALGLFGQFIKPYQFLGRHPFLGTSVNFFLMALLLYKLFFRQIFPETLDPCGWHISHVFIRLPAYFVIALVAGICFKMIVVNGDLKHLANLDNSIGELTSEGTGSAKIRRYARVSIKNRGNLSICGALICSIAIDVSAFFYYVRYQCESAKSELVQFSWILEAVVATTLVSVALLSIAMLVTLLTAYNTYNRSLIAVFQWKLRSKFESNEGLTETDAKSIGDADVKIVVDHMNITKKKISPPLNTAFRFSIVCYVSIVFYIIISCIDLWGDIAKTGEFTWTTEMYAAFGWLAILVSAVLLTLMVIAQLLHGLSSETEAWTLVRELCNFYATQSNATSHLKDLSHKLDAQSSNFVWNVVGTDLTAENIKALVRQLSAIIWSGMILPGIYFAFQVTAGIEDELSWADTVVS